MSQVVRIDSTPSARRTSGLAALARILLGAVAISAIASIAVLTVLEHLEGANEVPRLPPAPSWEPLPPAATAPGDTTVPDASRVLASRDLAVEEPAPSV
jgi:hypothetical protein